MDETPSWLTSLPSHPIFSSNRRAGAAHSSSFAAHADAGDALPPSPDASSIHSFDELAHEGDTTALTAYNASHISAAPSASRKRSVGCIFRRTDLALAVGKEVRLTSLAQYKTRIETLNVGPGSSANHAGPSSAGYKVIRASAIDFEIHSLVASPASRFLAVVGASQVVVISLPRKGWETVVGSTIDCSYDAIGRFYHSPSSPTIAKVAWHPWGDKDATLLVLTSDGLLREYDVLQDPQEPVQVTDFTGAHDTRTSSTAFAHDGTPTKAGKAASTSALIPRSQREGTSSRKAPSWLDVDADAKTAVSFCFGLGEGDWSPLTLYCLMQNGDAYCVCPYLPRTSRIPSSILTELSVFVSAKLDYLETQATEIPLSEKQVLESRYSAQLKFVDTLLAQGTSGVNDAILESDDEYLVIKYPQSYRRVSPLRQGPFLLQPAPIELEDSDESLATDIAYARLARDTEQDLDIGSVIIAYDDGKLDVCLDVEKVEARWPEAVDEPIELPTLIVYESIQLFEATSSSPVQLVADPEYSDALYIYHPRGVQTISLQSISSEFLSTPSKAEDEEARLSQALRKKPSSDVVWLLESSESQRGDMPVIFLDIINDVYLGYALLALTADMQLITMELNLRSSLPAGLIEASSGALVSSEAPGRLALTDAPKAYVAMPDSSKFKLPALLDKKTASPNTRQAAPASSRSAKVSADGTIELTVESLRYVGQSVEKLDTVIRELISAGNAVQERLEIHTRELPRQVGKLQDLQRNIKAKQDLFEYSQAERVAKVRNSRRDLEHRADRILQRLIDSSQPQLSAFERKWIEELERVEAVVQGQPGSSEHSRALATRAKRFEEQLAVLKDQLKDLPSQRPKEDQGRLGDSQKHSIEKKLAEETRLLSEARRKIERMQAKLGGARKQPLAAPLQIVGP